MQQDQAHFAANRRFLTMFEYDIYRKLNEIAKATCDCHLIIEHMSR